jgi:hypothetical protein
MNLNGNRIRGRGLDLFGSGQGPGVGCPEHGNESSGAMKSYEFLEWLSNSVFSKKTVPFS